MVNGQWRKPKDLGIKKYIGACCSKIRRLSFSFNTTDESAVVFNGIPGRYCPFCGYHLKFMPGPHDNMLKIFQWSPPLRNKDGTGPVTRVVFIEWENLAGHYWSSWGEVTEGVFEQMLAIAHVLLYPAKEIKGLRKIKWRNDMEPIGLSLLSRLPEMGPILVGGIEYDLHPVQAIDPDGQLTDRLAFDDPGFDPYRNMWDYKWSLRNPSQEERLIMLQEQTNGIDNS